MARSRNLKPGFFTNEHLAECVPLARLLFAGLWCVADKEGRLEDRPKKIKAELLPYDNCDADELIEQLQQFGFVLRYSSAGVKYIQILNFAKHQNPHIKEAESTIPAPEIPMLATKEVAAAHGNTGTSPADSLLLIPDSLCTTASTEADADFEDAWSIYPKRAGSNPKGKALKAWSARRKAGDSAEDMKAGVIRYAKFARDTGKEHTEFVMQAVKFFGPDRHFAEPWDPPNQERKAANWWDDDQATLAKGREYGLEPRSGEDWRAFKARINERLRVAA